jgi:hypothetical protein
MLGSQKLFRPNSSTVGIRTVQLGVVSEVPSMPRYANHACAWRDERPMASPPTWKFVSVSEEEGVKPPQGATSSLLMLLPRAGGVVTRKCAEDRWAKASPRRDMSLNEDESMLFVVEGRMQNGKVIDYQQREILSTKAGR